MLDLGRFLDLKWGLWGVLLLTEDTFWCLFELFEESFSLCSSLLKVDAVVSSSQLPDLLLPLPWIQPTNHSLTLQLDH